MHQDGMCSCRAKSVLRVIITAPAAQVCPSWYGVKARLGSACTHLFESHSKVAIKFRVVKVPRIHEDDGNDEDGCR